MVVGIFFFGRFWVVRMLGSRHALIPQRLIPTAMIRQKKSIAANGIYKKRKFRAAKKGGINIENGHTTAISIHPSEKGGKSCCCQKKF